MTKPCAFCVLHLDDEPEIVEWIPESLFYQLKQAHSEWKMPDDFEEVLGVDSTEIEVRFSIEAPSGRVEVQYYIVSSEDKYRARLPLLIGSIPYLRIVLDLMQESPSGVMEHFSPAIYVDACNEIGQANVFFMTGYKESISSGENIPSSQIVLKGSNTIGFMERMLQDIESLVRLVQ